MSAHFSFRHAAALTVFLLFTALPLGGAASAPGEPEFPTPSENGPLGAYLFAEQQVSTAITPTDPDRYRPDSAYDPGNGRFLVVWHQTFPSGHDREIYGQLIKPDGTKYGPPIVISSGTNDRIQPAVAYSATSQEYMVVYMYDVNGDGQKYDIRGQRINSSGALVGSSFLVYSYPNRSFWSPRIAWNSFANEFMIIWGALAQDTQIAVDIVMRAVDHTGAELWQWIVTDAGFPTNPDITFDPENDRYLAVWNYLNASGKQAIRGSLRYGNGNEVQPVNIYGSTLYSSYYPRVASSLGIFYAVVWEYENTVTDHDIYIALVTANAGAVIAAPYVDGSTHDTHPDVAGSSNRWEYVVNFQRADPFGAKVLMKPMSNYLDDDISDICNYAFTDCILPSMEFGGATFLHTYVIDMMTLAPEQNPSSPSVSEVQHVFTRPLNTATLYLPVIRN